MPNYIHYLAIPDAKTEIHEIAVVREKNGKLVVSLTAKGLESCTKSAEKLVNIPAFQNHQVWEATDIKRYTGRDVSAGEVIPKACLGRRLRTGEVVIRLFGWHGSFGKYSLPDPISGGEYIVYSIEPEKIPTNCPIIPTEIRKKGLNGEESIQKIEILAGVDKWFPIFPPKDPINVHDEKGSLEIGTELGNIVRGQFAKFKKEQGYEETRAPETSQPQETPLVSTLNTDTDETTSTPVKEEDETEKKVEKDDSAPCSLYDGKRFGVFIAIPKDGNTDHHFGKIPLPLHALEKIKHKYPTAEAWSGIQWNKENLEHGVNGYENTYEEVKKFIAQQPDYIKKMLYVGRRFGEADDLCICIDFDGGSRTLEDIIEMCGGAGIIERSMSGTGFHAFGGIPQQLKQQIDERGVSVSKNNGKEIDGINLKGDVEFRTGCSIKQNGTALTEDTVFTGTEFVFPTSSPCLRVLTKLITSSAPIQAGHTPTAIQPTQAVEKIINHFIRGTPLGIEIDPLIKDEFIPKVQEWAVLGHIVESSGLVYERDTTDENGKIVGASKCSNLVTSVFARINSELGEFAAIHDRRDLITPENVLYTLLSTEIGQYFYVERRGYHTDTVTQFLSMIKTSGYLERTAEAWEKVKRAVDFINQQEETIHTQNPIKAREEPPKPEQPATEPPTPQPSLPSTKHPAGFFIETNETGETVSRFYCNNYQFPLEYILAELANMVLERAFIPQWIYGYMGGMIIGSVLTARNYKLDGQFSNIYALLFGQSSVGKTSFEEAIQKVCNIIVKRCSLYRHLIGDETEFFSEGYAEVLLCGRANAASAAGAHVLHARNPHFIGFRDENQDDVGRLKKNEHEKGVSQYNTDLWSIKGEDKYPPVRADDGKPICKRGDYDLRRITIRRPAYSCIDAGIGESYAKELPAYIRDGTYARYLFITAPNIQDLKFNHEDNNLTPYELPKNRWSQLKGLLRNATFSPFLAGEIVTLRFAIGVLDIIDEKIKNIHNRTNKPNKIENTEATAMMAKACENATRLAISWTLLGTREGVTYLKELSKLPPVYSKEQDQQRVENKDQIKPKKPVILPTPPIVTAETWLKCYSITEKNYAIVQELFESFVVFDGKIVEFATKMYEIMNSKLPAQDSYITEQEIIQQMKNSPNRKYIEEIRECIKQNHNIIAFKSGCAHQIYYARDPEQAAAAIKIKADALRLAQSKKYTNK